MTSTIFPLWSSNVSQIQIETRLFLCSKFETNTNDIKIFEKIGTEIFQLRVHYIKQDIITLICSDFLIFLFFLTSPGIQAINHNVFKRIDRIVLRISKFTKL